MAVGLGFDFHKWSETEKGPIVLGAVSIDCDRGLVAHSDGDVVLHALIDALLGASGMPDIGDLFPDEKKEYEGISSAQLLKSVFDRAIAGRRSIVNVDIVIVLDKPKLSEKKQEIRRSIASLLQIEENKVGVKAKTTEGLFDKGIYSMCVVEVKDENT